MYVRKLCMYFMKLIQFLLHNFRYGRVFFSLPTSLGIYILLTPLSSIGPAPQDLYIYLYI